MYCWRSQQLCLRPQSICHTLFPLCMGGELLEVLLQRPIRGPGVVAEEKGPALVSISPHMGRAQARPTQELLPPRA